MHPVQAFLDFCDLVHAQDHHECWSMTWLDTMREGKSLTLRLGVHTGLDDVPDQVWEVGARHTRGVFPGRIRVHRVDDLGRPRLAVGPPRAVQPAQFPRPGVEPWRDPLGPARAAIARSPASGFRSIATSTAFLSNRLSGGCGVLADGPERLLARVRCRASRERSRAVFSLSRTPAALVGHENNRWVDRGPGSVGADPGGSSYIVGCDFFANRVE